MTRDNGGKNELVLGQQAVGRLLILYRMHALSSPTRTQASPVQSCIPRDQKPNVGQLPDGPIANRNLDPDVLQLGFAYEAESLPLFKWAERHIIGQMALAAQMQTETKLET